MQPFLFVLFVAVAAVSVSGKTIVLFEETDTDSALPNAGGSDLALETDDDSKTKPDDLDEWEADAFGELTPEDLDFLLDGYEYMLQKCGGGECKVCFGVWKLKAGGSFTVKIDKDKLPSFLRKFLNYVEVTFSGLDLAAKKVCTQVLVNVKWFGTVKWPRGGPYCLQL